MFVYVCKRADDLAYLANPLPFYCGHSVFFFSFHRHHYSCLLYIGFPLHRPHFRGASSACFSSLLLFHAEPFSLYPRSVQPSPGPVRPSPLVHPSGGFLYVLYSMGEVAFSNQRRHCVFQRSRVCAVVGRSFLDPPALPRPETALARDCRVPA